MYKKISIILLIHSIIILSWAWGYHQGLLISTDWVVNFTSILILGTVYGYIASFLSNRHQLQSQDYLQVTIAFSPLILILQVDLPYALLFGAISMSMTSFYLVKHLKWDQLQRIHLLPLSKMRVQTFTVIFTLFLMLMIYLLDLDGMLVHLFVHMIFLIFELCLLFFLKEKEHAYERIYQLAYLSDYLAQDRDEFARIIHDDLIQDVYAVKNLLAMKSPDVNYTREVLHQLESKARDIMNFYQNHLFENMNLADNLDSIFKTVQALYPQKNLQVNYQVSLELEQSLDKSMVRLLCILTKELVNNVFKHSQGTYLTYQVRRSGSDLLIEMESNGADAKDLAAIQNSKRGVLLMKLLVDTQSGSLAYQLNGDILSSQVCLKGEANETLTP